MQYGSIQAIILTSRTNIFTVRIRMCKTVGRNDWCRIAQSVSSLWNVTMHEYEIKPDDCARKKYLQQRHSFRPPVVNNTFHIIRVTFLHLNLAEAQLVLQCHLSIKTQHQWKNHIERIIVAISNPALHTVRKCIPLQS